MIKNSIFWCVGYLGMWGGKWILGTLLLPEAGSLAEAIKSITYRGSHVTNGVMLSVADVCMENVQVYLKWSSVLLIGLCGTYLIFRAIRGTSISHGFDVEKGICFIMICMYPIAWYYITQNHSFEHSFMAYRELAILTFSGLSFLANIQSK